MEVVGLALSVVGLAGPLSKACISGYELLQATTTMAEDAGDFRLRVDTEMGLLNLWIKHWVNQRTGRIRGSGEIGEEVCFLAIDILAKIGTLLVDAGKLQGKYGIHVRKGTGLSDKDSQSDLVGIGRVGTTISMLASSRGEGSGQVMSLALVKEDEKIPIVSTRRIGSRTTSEYSTGQRTSNTRGGSKESKFRQFLRKAGFLKSPAPRQAESSTQKTNKREGNLAGSSTTKVLTEPIKPSSAGETRLKNEIDIANSPIEEVFATLQSKKVEVETNLTKVQRLKWVMMDKEKAYELANELKGWNERLFALLPPRRLIPRSSKKNKHYTIPQRASPIFTGREIALSSLEEAFFGAPGDDTNEDDISICEEDKVDRQRRAVLYGLGGAGKTQIALKFAEDNRDRFDFIFWINSSSVASVEESFREMADLLRLPVGSSDNLIRPVKNRLAHLRDKNWLLIFDNADDISLVPYLPQGNHGNILITSRSPKVRQYLSPLDQPAYHVDEMSPDEAVELLLRAAGMSGKVDEQVPVGEENRSHARKIVEKLGCLALAIDQAGAYICNNGSLDTYLECYENFRADLLDMREYEASGYAYPVYQTWEISFQAVTKKSPAAADLLQVMGYLHYERIPTVIFETAFLESTTPDDESHPVTLSALKSLLQGCITKDDSTGALKWRSFHFDNAISQLNNYSLIKKNEPSTDRDLPLTYSLHPLVHCWIRDRKSVDEQVKIDIQSSTVSLLRNMILRTSGPTAYAMRSHLTAHIDNWVLSNFEKAPAAVFGPTQKSQMRSFEAFAIVYHEVGRLQIAMKLRETILLWRTENLLPTHHPDIISARTSLAETYRRATIDLPKALKLDTETVELLTHSPEHGPDHPTTLTAKLNLGSTLSDAGDRTGCERLEREVIASRTRLLGADHLSVAVARGNLGVSLLRLRRYPSAEVELRVAFSRRLSILGEKHPGTLLSMGNLAGALRGQGKYEEAIAFGKRVVEIRERLLGENHQDVAKAKANYGYTLMSAGKLEDARNLEQEALDQLEVALGCYHGSTMDTLSNLAQVYLKLMDVKQVPELVQKTESLLTDLVDRKTLVFGNEHKSTVEAVKLMTTFYEKIGGKKLKVI
ncbi:hypothetical protein L211DRAFT_832001 [Terfezia boudieri ATCC MYA-4762]|uniref:TPR-like protein n=1 Tax=Terfezia boudieri ATCC MYA-4762 TaxID=1051890 RepID=A0A3N4M9W5_9PEZI|nr:hypothetical protein L211DRAFT_832001 [Terfezia boudieri ATCC MYA-4762]